VNLGISQSALTNYLTGKSPVPEGICRKAAELTGLPVDFMLGGALVLERREPTRDQAIEEVRKAQANLDDLRRRLGINGG
jgi:transcriptional regulator with XRE-family HTH domain